MHATPSVHARRAPLRRWRLILLISVLAGFFFMHGLSGADSCVGAAHSLPADARSAAAVAPVNSTMASAALGGGSSQASPADQCCAAMGTPCVPQRPRDEAWLFVVLLLALAVPPTGSAAARLTGAVAWIARTGRRHADAAPPVLLLACVSRT